MKVNSWRCFTYAVAHAGASVVCQVGDMAWVSEDGNGDDYWSGKFPLLASSDSLSSQD